jgi:hypothetical protein
MDKTTPEVTVRAPTLEEEFNYLKYVLNRQDFYEKEGYKVSYPAVKELCDPLIINDPDAMFSLFKDSEYKVDFYKKGIDVISELLPLIQSNVSKLAKIQSFWDFKLLPTYTVVLTKYGPGGSYNVEAGKITMLTTIDGKFKRSLPHHTVLHEIVHMGIEDSIVQKYKLNHQEKERLVDLFVKKYFEKELPEYNIQRWEDSRIDKYIADLESLPKEIQEYTKNRNNQ